MSGLTRLRGGEDYGVRPTPGRSSTADSGVGRYVALALAVCLAGGGDALAQDKGKDDRKSADLQVWAIRATTKNKDISPELRSIADKLKKEFKYTGFKLEKTATGSPDIGKAFNAKLIAGYEANVTPQKIEKKRITLDVEVLKGKERKLKTTFTLELGKFQLQGGWELDGGDALIVAVSGR